MIPSRLPILATLAGLVTSLALTAPAAAAPPQRFDETEHFANVLTDYCGVSGLTATDNGTFHTSGKIRTTRTGVQYFLEHITVDDTVTGPTGTQVRIHTAYVAKDLKITVSGGLTTIISLLTGPSTAYGPDGKAIARDPGQARFRIVISDNGTPTDPTDDYEVSFDVVKGSTGRTDDYCAAIVPVIS